MNPKLKHTQPGKNPRTPRSSPVILHERKVSPERKVSADAAAAGVDVAEVDAVESKLSPMLLHRLRRRALFPVCMGQKLAQRK